MTEERAQFELIMKHGHHDLVQAVAFNAYGDRCATGSVDGKIRVFNRHKDSIWRLCDTWTAHGGEILEVSWLLHPSSPVPPHLTAAESHHSCNGSPRPSIPTSSHHWG